MDIKLKKSNTGRKGACIVSSIIFVISLVTTFISGIFLISAYQYGYHYEINPVIQADISKLWMIVAPAAAVMFISLIVTIITCGAKEQDGNIKLNWFDKIFNEIQIVAAVVLGTAMIPGTYMTADYVMRTSLCQGWINIAYSGLSATERTNYDIHSVGDIYNWMMIPTNFEPRWLEIGLGIAITAIVTIFTLLVLLSLVKKIKARCFWKHTIIGKLYVYLKNVASKSENIFWKVMGVAILACLVSATWIGLIPVLVLIVIFLPKWITKYQAIKDGVDEVKSGNLEYKIPVNEQDNSELDKLARSINEISASTNIAVQNELKNQRMKTDLISNVSHDLKTPLTSMISYVDLLKREGLDSENAPEYLDIVEEKTQRLKNLTEDLFEAAKASSGAIPVNMEKIEMQSLINQALGELEERLGENDLQVLWTPAEDGRFVNADGQLLWRVIENLLVNASKYALPGSRVYLDITEKGENMVLLEVKNMSKEPLNISADELMERFKRGDDSRNTEGSGLGLAIAKDLTKLMGGWFDISIDGDLFKASVALNKAE